MRLASFSFKNTQSFGIVTDKGVINLKKIKGNKYEDLKSFLENNDLENIKVDTEDKDYSLDEISFLPVIPNPL